MNKFIIYMSTAKRIFLMLFLDDKPKSNTPLRW